MGVTLTSAAERRRRAAPPAGWPRQASRRREGVLLAAALAAVLLGFVLAYLAMARSVAGVAAQLASGEVLDLSTVRQPEQLLPLLAFLPEPAERAFVAERIVDSLRRGGGGAPANIGELGRIRVPAAEIEARRSRLPDLGERLDRLRHSAAAGPAGAAAPSLELLTGGELRQLKPRLVVRTAARFRNQYWLWAGLVLAAFAAVHLAWRSVRFAGDELMLPALALLAGLGLMIMVTVRDPLRDLLLFRTFAQGVLGGCVLMFAASRIDFERSPLRRLSFVPLLAAVALSVLLILFGSGPGTSDAKVNLFGFQPVEVIKILIVLFLAGYFVERWEFLRELKERHPRIARLPRWLRPPKLEYALPPVVAIGIVLFFFFLQRDLGPALVLAFLFLLLYCVARGRPTMGLLGAALAVAGFFIGYRLGVPQTVTGRIAMWLSPWDNSFRGGNHLAQSLWAFAGGALSGTGLGLGEPARVPEVHTDLVLAAAGEELGFLGVAVILALYAVLLARSFRAALKASGAYTCFLGLGLALAIALPIVLIAGGVLGLLPLSGVVSPFLSFGRTSMLANFAIAGALLAISAHPGGPAVAERFGRPVRGVLLVLAVAAAAIVARAAYVQAFAADRVLTRGALTLQGDGFRRYEYNPRLEEIADAIPRGSIVDRTGLPLATSDAAELERNRAALSRLGAELPVAVPAGTRVYPFGGRTFHLLGDVRNRVNWAASNTSYAERDSRIRLQGYDDYAAVLTVVQPNGQKTPLIARDYRELIPLLRRRYRPDDPAVQRLLHRDRTLHMTLDARLQAATAAILERYVRAAGLGGAAAVVLDATTGDLLASVSYPWPRRLPVEPSSDADSGVIDRARYGIYPPGSTFKLVTAMAALRLDPALARRTFECVRLPDGRVGNFVRGWGSKPVRDDLIDTVPHGTVDLEKGIVVSCNAYFAQLAATAVGAAPLLETAKLLGISVARPNTPAQLARALPQSAYGQGQVIATPFQMARVAATVAAGGAMPQGRWVADESNLRRAAPQPVLAADATAFLARAMRRVVTAGTGARYLAGTSPAIAGKTGTAEVERKASHSWFAGFAPYEGGRRRIAFAVIFEHGGYGGRLAAPAAGEIVRAAAALGLL
jgi:cell division protein FtsW (lipid II flippase)